MVLFFTIVLGLSCAGMLSLLLARHFELRTGRIVFPSMRPRAHAFSANILHLIEVETPAYAHRSWEQCIAWARGSARASLARTLVALEQGLERALHALRHTTLPAEHATGQASAFLREVAEHKHKLMRRARMQGALVKEQSRAGIAQG